MSWSFGWENSFAGKCACVCVCSIHSIPILCIFAHTHLTIHTLSVWRKYRRFLKLALISTKWANASLKFIHVIFHVQSRQAKEWSSNNKSVSTTTTTSSCKITWFRKLSSPLNFIKIWFYFYSLSPPPFSLLIFMWTVNTRTHTHTFIATIIYHSRVMDTKVHTLCERVS